MRLSVENRSRFLSQYDEEVWAMKYGLRLMLLGAVLPLAACAQGDPAATVEAYLQAKVASDLSRMQSLSCAAWEGQAVIEATSFESMNAELDGMACQADGELDGATRVNCEGQITTVYNGETREWNLGAFPYRLVQEDGEWKMCGYFDEGEN
jgi:hypothetical protein